MNNTSNTSNKNISSSTKWEDGVYNYVHDTVKKEEKNLGLPVKKYPWLVVAGVVLVALVVVWFVL